MTEITAEPHDAPAAPRASDADLRRVADFMRLWRLCDQTRCRRARSCHGAPRACLTRLSPLIPEKAREFVVGLFMARECDRPFEEVEGLLWEEKQAFDAWLAALEAAKGRPRNSEGDRHPEVPERSEGLEG